VGMERQNVSDPLRLRLQTSPDHARVRDPELASRTNTVSTIQKRAIDRELDRDEHTATLDVFF